jgi:hypothetical protein
LQDLLAVLPGVLVALAFCAYYAAIRPTAVGSGDQAEFQVLVGHPGLPHCNGYPLYISTGWLLTRVLPGELAARVTLVSALHGAGALFMLYLLVRGLAPSRRAWLPPLLGVVAQAALGTFPPFVRAATLAEMYTLQWLLSLSFFYLLLRWERVRRPALLYGAGFLLGAMTGNHVTSLLLLPGAGVFAALLLRERTGRRLVLVALGAALAGVLLGNFLPYWLLWRRHVPFDHWHSVILPNAVNMGISPAIDNSVLASWKFAAGCGQASKNIGAAAWQAARGQLGQIGADLASLVTVPGVVLVLGGIAILAATRRRLALVLGVTVVVQVAAVVFQTNTTKHQVFALLPLMLCLIFAAVAAGWLVERLAESGIRQRALAGAALALAGIWTAVALPPERFATPTAAPPPESVATQVAGLPAGAVVFAPWRYLYRVRYEALTLGLPLQIYETWPEGPRRRRVLPSEYRTALEGGRRGHPVFLVGTPLPGYRWRRHNPNDESPQWWQLDPDP